MFIKIYEKVKKIIIENYLWFLLYLVIISTMLYPLPYYIYTGGGVIDISDKVEINETKKIDGSLNMCYVSEINATIPSYLISHLIKSWDVVSKKDIALNDKESKTDILTRDKLSLLKANQNAIINAFNYASASYSIKDKHNYIIYIDSDSKTNLSIGDELLKVDNQSVSSIDAISNVLETKNVGDRVVVSVKSKESIIDKYAIVNIKNGKKIIGIAFETIYDYETKPSVNFDFSNNESGPSGGLMLSLFIYNKLVNEDITRGLKISGTGTISEDGTVGEIGGVKYKLNGAIKAKSDVFLVPNGENYQEAINEQKKHNYKIKIIGVSNFEEALKKLKEM